MRTATQIEADITALVDFLRVNYSPLMSEINFQILINELRELRRELNTAYSFRKE